MADDCLDEVETIQKITGLMFRVIREEAGLDLHQVARYLELTPDDLDDHEEGLEPLSAAKLYQAGLLFGVTINAFFQPFYWPTFFEMEGDPPVDG